MSLPNTANAIARGSLFPPELIPEFFNQVRGKSSLAKMCGASPIPFNGLKEFTFSMDNEVDIVAEAGAKSAGGGQVGSVTVVPVKIEYGMRVSDEFIFGSEEVALDYLRAFSEGWSAKVALTSWPCTVSTREPEALPRSSETTIWTMSRPPASCI